MAGLKCPQEKKKNPEWTKQGIPRLTWLFPLPARGDAPNKKKESTRKTQASTNETGPDRDAAQVAHTKTNWGFVEQGLASTESHSELATCF